MTATPEPAPALYDSRGLRYEVVDGYAFYVTDCCDMPMTISGGVDCCKGCYEEVDDFRLGLPPEIPPLDMHTATLVQIANAPGYGAQTAKDRAHAQALIAAGARREPCPCGYGVFDSCPNCD